MNIPRPPDTSGPRSASAFSGGFRSTAHACTDASNIPLGHPEMTHHLRSSSAFPEDCGGSRSFARSCIDAPDDPPVTPTCSHHLRSTSDSGSIGVSGRSPHLGIYHPFIPGLIHARHPTLHARTLLDVFGTQLNLRFTSALPPHFLRSSGALRRTTENSRETLWCLIAPYGHLVVLPCGSKTSLLLFLLFLLFSCPDFFIIVLLFLSTSWIQLYCCIHMVHYLSPLHITISFTVFNLVVYSLFFSLIINVASHSSVK